MCTHIEIGCPNMVWRSSAKCTCCSKVDGAKEWHNITVTESRCKGSTKAELQIKFFTKNKHCLGMGAGGYPLGTGLSEVSIPIAWYSPNKRHCVPGVSETTRGKLPKKWKETRQTKACGAKRAPRCRFQGLGATKQ